MFDIKNSKLQTLTMTTKVGELEIWNNIHEENFMESVAFWYEPTMQVVQVFQYGISIFRK